MCARSTDAGRLGEVLRALVIDDDPIIAGLLGEMFGMMGFQADRCCDPVEGVRRALSGDYAFVSTDMSMPKLHGREVVRRIRDSRPDLPVFVISGYLDEELVSDLRELGVMDIIHKPFTFRVIEKRIGEAARRIRP